ncbi:hypothetical protein BDK51DRAFT_49795 [Blyttiomyces helicus]|uniref:Reelin domain-containing protein n=1 Tax=Blyttiomyces helicus TaxID=388810 RepID=A0A4P9WFV0_9FUNG|nr:hypothetical protein BDK51DRAFT_49795 [Blyttiomyces helicus]|eukprot:RKO90208.1 hypothetical protein BDK51DRAFT_49795 [Blyttiomyces helicus]
MRAAFTLAAALALAGSVSTYPTYPGVCTVGTSDVAAVAANGNMGPQANLYYTLETNASTYTPGGQPIGVTIGGLYAGLLLFAAESGGSAVHVGTWGDFDTNSFQTLDHISGCTTFGAGSTLGHKNGQIKTGKYFTWTPPTTNAGSLAFYAIVVSANAKGFQTLSSTISSTVPTAVATGEANIQFTTIAAIPETIRPDKTYHRLQAFHAVGSQIYNCTLNGTTPTWVATGAQAQEFRTTALTSPVAEHFFLPFADAKGGRPSWFSLLDNTFITGIVVATLPVSAAKIPWTRLQLTSTSKAGLFAGVKTVIRVNTEGGVAPAADTCTDVGKVALQPYTADYWYFG